jgi:Caspase domain/Photosynthesis system II assembly factor YCF48
MLGWAQCARRGVLIGLMLISAAAAQKLTSVDIVARAPRFALVIGNANYAPSTGFPKLSSPLADAVHMADALKDLGFTVHGNGALLNLSHNEMREAITAFRKNLPEGALVWFYYSGHGSERQGQNYLFAVDDDDTEGVQLNHEVLELLDTAKSVATVVVLDACRDDRRGRKGMARPGSSERLDNFYIEFPTSPGDVTPDDSPYTRTLLRHMRQPGLRLDDVFNRTREDVVALESSADKNHIPQGFGSPPATPIYLRPQLQWQQVRIQGQDEHKRPVLWSLFWRDIIWNGAEGWLCAAIEEGGGGGDVGRGALLHSANQGALWTIVDSDKFNSGSGHFRWGRRGTYIWSWKEIGPINAILLYARNLGEGKRQVEIFLAANTGVYSTQDNGETWQRSTPQLPQLDDPQSPDIYAHFFNLAKIEGLAEVYAVGWQGISHWYSSNSKWEVQLPTYSYYISAIDALNGSDNRSVWAVGPWGANEGSRGGPNHGAIYHLRWPENQWERLLPTGVSFEPGQSLTDIRLVDPKTGFAIGSKGVILRGSQNEDGTWTWKGIASPTKESLNSIAYAGGRLWIVGDNGIVLSSRDLGKTWNVSSLKDDQGNSPNLKRIRFFGDTGWILGGQVVFKSVPGAD